MKNTVAILISIIMILNTNIVYGTTIDSLRERQQQNNSTRDNTRVQLEDTRSEISAEQSEFDNIDFELEKVTSELEEINSRLEEISEDLLLAEEELEQAMLNKEAQTELYEERLRAMYMHGRRGYLDILFDAENLSDFFARLVYMGNIILFDQNLIIDMMETKSLIVEKRETILNNKSQAESLLLEQTRKTLVLEETLAEKGRIISNLEADEQRYLREISLLEESNREIERLIRIEQTPVPNNTYRGGRVAWPVPSRSVISSGFGSRTSPISGRTETHSGIDIPAPHGTSIVAAESGRVIFAGRQNGYGNTVIIDHGNGFSTLYGHMSSIQVSVGQNVTRGQHIARVGTTGMSTGNHLHFETRINGRAVNPMNYLN